MGKYSKPTSWRTHERVRLAVPQNCLGSSSGYILSTHSETKCILSFGAGCSNLGNNVEDLLDKYINSDRRLCNVCVYWLIASTQLLLSHGYHCSYTADCVVVSAFTGHSFWEVLGSGVIEVFAALMFSNSGEKNLTSEHFLGTDWRPFNREGEVVRSRRGF